MEEESTRDPVAALAIGPAKDGLALGDVQLLNVVQWVGATARDVVNHVVATLGDLVWIHVDVDRDLALDADGRCDPGEEGQTPSNRRAAHGHVAGIGGMLSGSITARHWFAYQVMAGLCHKRNQSLERSLPPLTFHSPSFVVIHVGACSNIFPALISNLPGDVILRMAKVTGQWSSDFPSADVRWSVPYSTCGHCSLTSNARCCASAMPRFATTTHMETPCFRPWASKCDRHDLSCLCSSRTLRGDTVPVKLASMTPVSVGTTRTSHALRN